jgi:hypothetical protein
MTEKTHSKRSRALAAALKELGAEVREGADFELVRGLDKRWSWVPANAIQPKTKDRVFDVSAPDVLGTVTVAGPNVSEVKWDSPESWGKVSNTVNKHLRFAAADSGIPEDLKVVNRKPLTPEQEVKLKEIQHSKDRQDEKVDVNLPRNIEPAGFEILAARKTLKNAEKVSNKALHQPEEGQTEMAKVTKGKGKSKDNGKIVKVVRAKHANGDVKPSSKLAIFVDMVTRKGGASQKECAEAMGWKVVSMTMRAKDAGLTLHKEKGDDGVTRYLSK